MEKQEIIPATKILFADIDGVLNNDTSVSYYYRMGKDNTYSHLDPMCIENLRYILKKVPDLKFVISSSWRKACEDANKEKIIKACQEHDFDLPLHDDWHTIRHWTIEKNYLKGRKSKYYKIDWRGNEVAEWLSRHPEVKMWICLDDDSDFMPYNNLVQTENSLGLTRVEAEIIVSYFTKDIVLATECKTTLRKWLPKRNKNNLKLLKKV